MVLKPFDGFILLLKIVFDSEESWVQLYNLLLACMNEKVWNLIGNSIGKTIEVKMQEDGSGWGKLLRVKIEFQLRKPILLRRHTVNLGGTNLGAPKV